MRHVFNEADARRWRTVTDPCSAPESAPGRGQLPPAKGETMKINANTTMRQIRSMLTHDGYDPSLAEDVRRAHHAGCLLWTRDRLTTTDASRIDVRPQRARSESRLKWLAAQAHITPPVEP
jgi:hypothetical protein